MANIKEHATLSAAPNYAEARSAESRKDFVHKMKISLKELRETMVWLKIIARKRLGDCLDIPGARRMRRADRHFHKQYENR